MQLKDLSKKAIQAVRVWISLVKFSLWFKRKFFAYAVETPARICHTTYKPSGGIMLLKGYRKEVFRPECNPGFQSLHCIAHLDDNLR